MIGRVVGWCTRRHWIVIAVAIALGFVGELARRSLARDAIPDLSDPQIVLVADWMGHPASEVASKVTSVLTEALDGVPGSTAVRGSSMAGMAYVDVVFESSSQLKQGREAISKRVRDAERKLPPHVRVDVGPTASSTGWVFQYALIAHSPLEAPLELRRLQEAVFRPALEKIPGVAEVAGVGGDVQQALVAVKPEQLRARGLAFTDVVDALRPTVKGLSEADLRPIMRASLKFTPLDDGSTPARIADLAHVHFNYDMPSGVADLDGVYPAAGGIVIADRDADPTRVVAEAKRTVEQLSSRLKKRIEVVTVYDRGDLIDRVGATLLRALSEEVGVVVLVILMFLLHFRSALIPLSTLPLVLLLTFAGMWVLGVPATIMSLGGIGIALGMAVDADVVALEACHRRLEAVGKDASAEERRKAILAAAGSFAPAILTSLLITALSFLPVFAFTGETGRLLAPLAITKTLVIVAAAVVALTLAPALREVLLRGRPRREFDNPLTRGLVRIYRPFVHFALERPVLTLVTAALAVLSALPITTRLGGEFLPRLDEGSLLAMPTTLPGVSSGEAALGLAKQDRAIKQFEEVSTVFGKIGRADTATDPAPYSMAETTIQLKPRSEWPLHPRERWYSGWAPDPIKPALGLVWPERTPLTMAELIDELDHATRLPGWTNAWTAPIRARMDMMATGVRTPVGIRIVAKDTERLEVLGSALQKVASRVSGTRSAVFEALGGEAWPRFDLNTAAADDYQLDPAHVQETADFVLTGGQIGELEFESLPYRVRIAPDADMDMSYAALSGRLRDVTVRPARGGGPPVPLAMVGRPTYVDEPAMIRSERGESVAYVYVDLHEGTDLESYVERAQAEVEQAVAHKELELEPKERIEWTGQFELLSEGRERLNWIIPLVALSMLGLLFMQFRSLTEALIVLASVPFALVGSFWTLYLLDYSLSAPVWVGLLSTVGLAMQTGVVMVVYIDEAFHRRVRAGTLQSRADIVAAHAEGTVQRLRPKIMTITTMAAGLLPLLWADGAGAEVMKRVAAPMLGGLVTSAFLTLEVIPVLYTIWRYRQLQRAQRTGTPLDKVVGRVPAWAAH